ncbi:hypothetical protein [Thauera propionica]|uniref:hypothetical protein n=1 Tax=Thauera propionica TaxID=2019431 RepID=UPI0023F53909|nr:hypothetical protein [Thauera propionica]MDD3675220.1 hypothetical protein [Thauera propionica]
MMRTLQRAIGQRLSLLAIWLLCQVAAAVASAWMLLAIVTGSRRAWTLAVSYDQLANAAFGGHEDETISSRAGKAAREGKRWACVLCRLLDRLDPNHCEKAIEPDEGKPLR